MPELPPALVLLAGALLVPALPRWLRPALFLVFPVAALLMLLRLEPGTALSLSVLEFELVPLRVDRLSLAFGYIFALIALLGGLYAYHLDDAGQQAAALAYAGCALGVVFAGDLLTLFVFWEIMAVASVFLIWCRRTEPAYRSGIRYLFFHFFGGGLLLAGIILHWQAAGTLAFDPLGGGTAAWLILLAFAVNAAIPPLHAWLADSYPEGTVTGSVFLSAFTTKAAVYALARGFPGWEILIWAGVIMALYGVVYAVLANDIRRILAYHIISQVGYMVAGVGIGTETALNGATAHAFTHILYKALLFMGAGAVLYATGRSKLTELGGLARAMPVVLSLYMVGAFSISGFPLFSGFVSKPLTVYGAELVGLGTVALLLNVASVGTFLHTGLKLPYFTWFGPQRGLTPAPVPRGMYAAMGAAAFLNVWIGVAPAGLYSIMPFPIDYEPYTASHVIKTMQMMLFTGLGFWWLIDKLGGVPTIAIDTDWFYRRPAPLAVSTLEAVGAAFGAVERLSLRIVAFAVRVSRDPLGYLLRGTAALRGTVIGAPTYTGAVRAGPPERHFPLGASVLVFLLCLVALLAGFLLV